MRRTFLGVFVAALSVLLVAVPTSAQAKFTRTVASSLAVSSDTLSAPANVRVTCNTRDNGIKVTWTATVDQYATGYTVYGKYGGYEQAIAVSGRTTSSYTYTSDVPYGTSVQLVSVYRNWTSVRTTAVHTTC